MELTTAAEQAEWGGYLRSNPERVLAVFRICGPQEPPNSWGDTHAVRDLS